MRGYGDEPTLTLDGLDPHDDARAIIRHVQCPVCSLPYKRPTTFPCGHTLCSGCIPTTHIRTSVSYPADSRRRQGFCCPVPDCGLEHALADCNLDVQLSKVLESFHAEITDSTPQLPDSTVSESADQAATNSITTTVVVLDPNLWASEEEIEAREKSPQSDVTETYVLPGSRLVATYALALEGNLNYWSECLYTCPLSEVDTSRAAAKEVVVRLGQSNNGGLDCGVCYRIMLDPVTTPCGHTFCRQCLSRTLRHNWQCPACRADLPIPPSLDNQASNVVLMGLLDAIRAADIAARLSTAQSESEPDEFSVPLFVCTVSLPYMPTFLHIFEPRYRLMIQRVLEGDRRFGMVMNNRNREPQGELGVTHFLQYGTMVEITETQMFPDGRSFIETRGVGRFKVLDHGTVDGYTVGKIEPVEDLGMLDEERTEAAERLAATALDSESGSRTPEGPPEAMQDPPVPGPPPLEALATLDLFRMGESFIEKCSAQSAVWLRRRILLVYGDPPDDPALFPYWFASVCPLGEIEKYKLLPTTSVRERLKIVCGWIQTAETPRSASNPRGICCIL
ncbi:PUA-like domain-containing protein [Lineolata rhizophorae]|uniref:PUA-like domain-containing protein n=1 Tax=Lineolata rhizophorae TaxID=578093 RepID=A0A6A6P258_9PEZI|nr:PUA-like domain-containing protein [Lineolata rhizophorae]